MAFISLEEYPEFKVLPSHLKEIKEELDRLQEDVWLKWLSEIHNCVSGEWSAFPIYASGKREGGGFAYEHVFPSMLVEKLKLILPQLFPCTIALLKQIDPVTYAAFSRLKPRTELAPHTHDNDKYLIFHMAIRVPTGGKAGLSAEDEKHIWQQAGDCMIFDNSKLHSAWNRSDTEERVVLHVEFIRKNS